MNLQPLILVVSIIILIISIISLIFILPNKDKFNNVINEEACYYNNMSKEQYSKCIEITKKLKQVLYTYHDKPGNRGIYNTNGISSHGKYDNIFY